MKCKWTECDNDLPDERRYNQNYCCQKCYAKQNAAEAKAKKVKKFKKRKLAKIKCRLLTCGKEFERVGKQMHKQYCSEECRKESLRLRQRARRAREGITPRKEKKVVIVREPKSTISSFYLTRGLITNNCRGSAISYEA